MWLKESKKILQSELAKSCHFRAILRRILKFRKKPPIVLVMLMVKFLVVLFVNNYFNASTVRIKWKKRKCSLQIPSIFEYSFIFFTNRGDLSRKLRFILTQDYKLHRWNGRLTVTVDDCANVSCCVNSVHRKECDCCICFYTTRSNTTTERSSNNSRGFGRSLYNS